jgi:hypothetical protein
MSKFQKEVLKLAALIGDPKCKSLETVDFIASELQVSYDDVRQVFKGK